MGGERAYTFDDKSGWGVGPWQHEPDKVVWVDDATGLDCMVIRNRVGALCGYVGVPEGHPWHGQDYDAVDADVHGGLTFAAPCQEGKAEGEHAICHTPREGTGEVWWLGFDCAHVMDLCPQMDSLTRGLGLGGHEDRNVYRDLAYVQAEVASLAGQAAKAAA